MVVDQNFHRVKKFFLLIFFLLFSSNSYSENFAKLNFDIIKKNGMITTFGNYISPKNKINTPWGSHYYLPSDTFAKKVQSSFSSVFWTNSLAWGNLNGDGIPDLVMGWEMHTGCPGLGKKDTKTGTWYCETETPNDVHSMLPFSMFEISNSSREDLVDNIIVTETITTRNCLRPLVIDFNSDGIDDLFCPSSTWLKNKKGNNVYGGADMVFISNDKGQWVQKLEKGDMVNKKGFYMGFSHGATAADIDNDGDIDVITPHIEWEKTKGGGKIYCHVNDGKGNFTVKWCADQFAFSVTTGDYNGDGNVDLMASGGWHQRPAYMHNNSKKHQQSPILLGDGKGKFGKKRKWKYLEPSYDIYGSNFLFTSVIGPVSWDFDNDGDVDIAGSSIGPLYVGGTHTIWENDGKGNFTVADQVPFIPSPKRFKSRKEFKKEIVMETNEYNSYCGRSVLIDLNEDGLMDIFCDSPPQDIHNGWFFLNEGNLEFKKISPYKAWEEGWVDYYTGKWGGQNTKFEGFLDANRMAPGKGMWKYKSDF
tara:strand:+ start:29 stop:1627 length:1599 start_codon:yes stop_codon:yes gene_type:complete